MYCSHTKAVSKQMSESEIRSDMYFSRVLQYKNLTLTKQRTVLINTVWCSAHMMPTSLIPD